MGLRPLMIAGVFWVPAVLVMASLLPMRRAIIAAYVAGWLLLPVDRIALPGFTDINKLTLINLSVLLAILLLDSGQLSAFRFRWFDLPMLIFCLCPFVTAVTNEMGLYAGLSGVGYRVAQWGLTYLIGRLYLTDLAAVRELAVGILIGGIFYMPLCWYEMRMSPRLHHDIWGYHPSQFVQDVRGEFYRPKVFLNHGLMVSLWMMSTALVGLWLWMSGAVRKLWGVPMYVIVPLLIVTTMLCRSGNATVLLVMGVGTLLGIKLFRLRVVLALLVAMGPVYFFVRSTMIWDGEGLSAAAEEIFNRYRAGSLQMRLDNENLVVDKVWEAPLFGLGPRGYRGSEVVTDGLWVIVLGMNGFLGLIALTSLILLPPLLLLWRLPASSWNLPAAAPLVILALVLSLYMINLTMNSSLVPMFILAAGGIMNLVTGAAKAQTSPVRGRGPGPIRTSRPRQLERTA